MKIKLLCMIFIFSTASQLFSQENGVVALALPVRNSLKFNKQVINPTFSFVREQNAYISFSNKRQTQFEGAPQSYLFGYSGRIGENNGAGITLFQWDYGVFTNFGGILNFSHNVVLDTDSNLTFGLNIGAYKSGLNNGKVVTNSPEPSLDNVPSQFLLTIAPGINYGTAFLDFGVSMNNLVSYNVSESKVIEENPEQALQAHLMYTGYMDSRGFFHDTKFSALVRSEFKKEKTVLSGVMMLTVPKGIWGQIGYNTFYGASGGVGFNISSQIALEYNYEQSISNLYDLGSSHEITLAYRFNRKQRYNYSDFDDEVSLFQTKRPRRTSVAKSKPKAKPAKVKPEPKPEVVAEVVPEPVEEIKPESKPEVVAEVVPEPVEEIKPESKPEEIAEVKPEPKPEPVAEVGNELKKETPKLAQLEIENKTLELPEVKIDTTLVKPLPPKPEIPEEVVEEKVEETKDEVVVDEETKLEEELTVITDGLIDKGEELLADLQEKVDIKQKDLKDLKEENDLSEKGIYIEPKPFKSLTAENASIEAIKLELDQLIEDQNIKLIELETVYINIKKSGEENTTMGIQYLNAIEELKAERLKTIQRKETLVKNLEQINIATEIERKRRIKRALYDDEQDRYAQDRAVLKVILENTPRSNQPLAEEDLDFGETQNSGIQILKDVTNVESGYYLVIAVHSDVSKRDAFLRKVVASGNKNIDFFYDVNTSKYYIYHNKYDNIDQAQNALKEKGNRPYDSKMSIVKIE